MSRKIEILREPNGIDVIAKLPLDDTGGVHCEMDLSSYHALLRLGYAGKLSYLEAGKKKYPCYRDPVTTRHILVGRLLAECKEGEIAKYKDGNPCNLRLNNLRVV